MIRSLRRRHLAIWLGLAVLLPILFVAALRARHAEPRTAAPLSHLVTP
jgi:hypothetical protein